MVPMTMGAALLSKMVHQIHMPDVEKGKRG